MNKGSFCPIFYGTWPHPVCWGLVPLTEKIAPKSQTQQAHLMPKRSILVSSDHNTFSQALSKSLSCSLETLRFLQDFNPLCCSALPMVFLVTVVPATFRSLTNSSSVVFRWSGTLLIRQDFAWSFRPSEIDSFRSLPFPNNHTNSCYHLTKFLDDGPVANSSLAQLYNPVTNILWQLFGHARGGGEIGRGKLR